MPVSSARRLAPLAALLPLLGSACAVGSDADVPALFGVQGDNAAVGEGGAGPDLGSSSVAPSGDTWGSDSDALNGLTPTAFAAQDGGASAPAPVVCPTPTLAAGNDEIFPIMHGGIERSYTMHVGATVNTAEATPLVISFHGLNNSPDIQAGFSNMSPKSDEAGFIVVYPQGISASFNAGSCCGSSDADDVGFTLAIIEEVSTRLCVDPRRIYATGFSNGGFMSHRMACEHADIFAAVAPVAGSMGVTGCAPSRPVPVMGVHHAGDPVVSYDGGRKAIDEWAALNHCDPATTKEAYGASECEIWNGCDAGSEVRFCTWNGGLFGHLWPEAEFAATDEIWEFFKSHPLPL